MSVLFTVAAVAVSVVVGTPAGKPGAPGKAFQWDVIPYRAYWLTGPVVRGESREYLWLLVTRGPIEDLAGAKKRPALLFDDLAFTFRTYQKDSLWSDPFRPVQQFGPVSREANTAVLDGVTYKYESCPLKDVVRLLEKPLGTIPVHRGPHPLAGAEQTAKAFRLLLVEQMKAEK
jgi:hypothetical protein